MQVRVNHTRVVELQLSEAEALWLRAYMQNPRAVNIRSDAEPSQDRHRRENLFTALSNGLDTQEDAGE